MLKLSKYEFRKTRTILLIIALGLIVLEFAFLMSCLLKKNIQTAISGVLLYLYALICFFMVFILAVVNYSRELSSKSSYLIFMTPNSALNIIVSKMFTILIIGIGTAAVIFGIACLDFCVLTNTYPSLSDFRNLIKLFAAISDLDLAKMALTVIFYILEFLISFFSTVTLVYLAITLSATLLQNHHFRWIISVVLFFVMTFIINKIAQLLPVIYDTSSTLTMGQTLLNLLPSSLFNLVVMIGCIFGCAELLEKKVSL